MCSYAVGSAGAVGDADACDSVMADAGSADAGVADPPSDGAGSEGSASSAVDAEDWLKDVSKLKKEWSDKRVTYGTVGAHVGSPGAGEQSFVTGSATMRPECMRYKTSDAWEEYMGTPDTHYAVNVVSHHGMVLREMSGASIFLALTSLHYDRWNAYRQYFGLWLARASVRPAPCTGRISRTRLDDDTGKSQHAPGRWH